MKGLDPVRDATLQRLMEICHSDTMPGGALLAGRYEIRERVGRGGMGDVYRGWDQRLHRIVAIKLVRNERAYDPDFRARFERLLSDRGRVVSQGYWLGCVAGEDSSRRKSVEEFVVSKLGEE